MANPACPAGYLRHVTCLPLVQVTGLSFVRQQGNKALREH